MSDTFEVFVLLDHATELAVDDASVDGWLLSLTAAMYLAAEEACGAPASSPELPETVRECVSRAAELTGRWDSSRSSTAGQMLATLLAELNAEMGR